MSNSGMTKTPNECVADMSDEDYLEWVRERALKLVKEIHEFGWMQEYRYLLVSGDVMDARNSADVIALFPEILFAWKEKRHELLQERWNKGALLISKEPEGKRRDAMLQRLHEIEKERDEVLKDWKTKY